MKRNQGMKIKRRYGFNFLWMQMAGALMLLAAAPSAMAETYYWDSDGITAGFGSTTGTWGTDAFWTKTATGGSPHSAVTLTTSSDAVNFGNTGLNYGHGTVGIATGGVSAKNIDIEAGQTTPLTLGSATDGSITVGAIYVLSTGHKISSKIITANKIYIAANVAGANFTIDGEISGSYGMLFSTWSSAASDHTQTINLGKAATYTGNTTLNNLNIQLPLTLKNTSGAANVLPTGTVLTFGTGLGTTGGRTTTFDLNGQNQTLAGLGSSTAVAVPDLRSHVVTSATAATLTINNTANYTFGGATLSGATTTSAQIAGAISLVKNGAGTFTLGGTLTGGATEQGHTYTGTTEIKEGTLSASKIVVTDSNSHLGNATSAVTLGAASTQGILSYTGTSDTYTRGFTIGGAGGGRFNVTTAGQTLTVDTGDVTGTGQFTVGGAGNTTINANLTHTGDLTKSDAGTLTLSGNNTYSGATTIRNGTLMGVVGGSCANSAVTNSPGSGDTASLGVSVTDPTKQWSCQSLTTDGLGTPTLTFDFGAVTPSLTLAPLNVVGVAAFTKTPKVVVTNGVLEQKAYPLMTWGSTSGTPPGTPDLILGADIKGRLSVVGNTLYLMLFKGTLVSFM